MLHVVRWQEARVQIVKRDLEFLCLQPRRVSVVHLNLHAEAGSARWKNYLPKSDNL